MQQTDKYKLNKPGVDDPMAIGPLNENADKLDTALASLDDAAADLTQRMVTLENCRVVMGGYRGNSRNEGIVIDLGERPAAVLVCINVSDSKHHALIVGDAVCYYTKELESMKIVDNGFWVNYDLNIDNDFCYSYMAFLGDWSMKDFFIPPKAT